jgi:hypothetical protein
VQITVHGTIVRNAEAYKMKNTGTSTASSVSLCFLDKLYSRIASIQVRPPIPGGRAIRPRPSASAARSTDACRAQVKDGSKELTVGGWQHAVCESNLSRGTSYLRGPRPAPTVPGPSSDAVAPLSTLTGIGWLPQTKPTTEAGAPAGVSCLAVALAKPLEAGGAVGLDVAVVYTLVQTAYPATLTQGETQLMVYTDNLYVVSPYTVSAQVTEVRR